MISAPSLPAARSFTAESFGVSAQMGSGLLRGKVPPPWFRKVLRGRRMLLGRPPELIFLELDDH